MSKNKEQRTSYDYQHEGPEEFCNKVTVQAGIDGVLQVHIDVMLEHNHRWYLQERYDNENRDWDHVRRQVEAENVNTDEGYEGCEIADVTIMYMLFGKSAVEVRACTYTHMLLGKSPDDVRVCTLSDIILENRRILFEYVTTTHIMPENRWMM